MRWNDVIAAPPNMGETRKTLVPAGLSMVVGVVIGASAIQALYALAKPPADVVIEAGVKNPEAFAKNTFRSH